MRLREVLSPKRLAEGSREVMDYQRKLETLQLDPINQRAVVDIFVADLSHKFEPHGDLVLSQRAENIITRANQLGVDPRASIILAGDAAIKERRKKLANCGGAKAPLTELEDTLTRVVFERSKK